MLIRDLHKSSQAYSGNWPRPPGCSIPDHEGDCNIPHVLHASIESMEDPQAGHEVLNFEFHLMLEKAGYLSLKYINHVFQRKQLSFATIWLQTILDSSDLIGVASVSAITESRHAYQLQEVNSMP